MKQRPQTVQACFLLFVITPCIGDEIEDKVFEGEGRADDVAVEDDDKAVSGIVALFSAKAEYVWPAAKSSRRTLPKGEVAIAEEGLDETDSRSLNGVAVLLREGSLGR